MSHYYRAKTVIVLRLGCVGDTLVAIPFLRLLRKAFPDAKIIYVSEHIIDSSRPGPHEVIGDYGLVDVFYRLNLDRLSIKQPAKIWKLTQEIRRLNPDIGFICESGQIPMSRKHLLFLRMLIYSCHPKRVIAPKLVPVNRNTNGMLIPLQHETDVLIRLLGRFLDHLPAYGDADFSIPQLNKYREKAIEWLNKQSAITTDSKIVAVCVGSGFPSTRWPVQRYARVLGNLVKLDKKVYPILIGGNNESGIVNNCISMCGVGTPFLGQPLPLVAEVMRKSKLYLGNDTGPMHLAALVGLPCVAVFSSRNPPGNWYPYGKIHTVFRKATDCEGCMLSKCDGNKMKCIESIETGKVEAACWSYLKSN